MQQQTPSSWYTSAKYGNGHEKRAFYRFKKNIPDSTVFHLSENKVQWLHVTTPITSYRMCHNMVRQGWSLESPGNCHKSLTLYFQNFKISPSCSRNISTPRGNPYLLILGTTESEKFEHILSFRSKK